VETWTEQRARLESMAVELDDCTLLMATGEKCVCAEKAAAIKEALRRLDLLQSFANDVVADLARRSGKPPDFASHSDV